MSDDLKKQAEQPSSPAAAPTRAKGGDWSLVPMSGLIAGVVFGIAFAKLGAPSLLIGAVVWIICVQNRNFRYSSPQKAVATVIMLSIALFGRHILELWKGLYH